MNFKKAQLITEETVKQAVKMNRQSNCACGGNCVNEVYEDCACEVYSD